MPDVHDRPPVGKHADPSAALLCLRRFVEAAYALDDAWHPGLDRRTYPKYLPSFDTFLSDLLEWRDEVEEREEIAESDVRPLVFADADAVRAWLALLHAEVDDAIAAGEDATRPLGRRSLGRLTARRALLEARGAINRLLEAADRGAAAPGSS